MAKFKVDDRVKVHVNGKEVYGRVLVFLGGAKDEYTVEYLVPPNNDYPARVTVQESEIEFSAHDGQRYLINERVYVYADYDTCLGWGIIYKYLGKGMYTVSFISGGDGSKIDKMVTAHEDNIELHPRASMLAIDPQHYACGKHVCVYSNNNPDELIGFGNVRKYIGKGMYTLEFRGLEDSFDSKTGLMDTHEKNLTKTVKQDFVSAKDNWMRTNPAIKEQLDRIEAKLDKLQIDVGTDSPVFNCGRSEGWSDVCAELRSILDPKDTHHWNKDGLLKEVKNIVDSRAAASELRKEAK